MYKELNETYVKRISQMYIEHPGMACLVLDSFAPGVETLVSRPEVSCSLSQMKTV